MARASVFGEAFLDGFTMAGLRKLRSPASPDSLCAPEEPAPRTVSFEISDQDPVEVQVRGDLHEFSSSALTSIMQTLSAEQRSRKLKEMLVHGSRK